MKWTVVRYRTKPEATEENARLIAAVFAALRTRTPEGLRYAALRLEDGSFIHVSCADDNSTLTTLDEFRAFRSGVEARCLEPPKTATATVVGNYRMLAAPSDE
jgi:hypothetical protein